MAAQVLQVSDSRTPVQFAGCGAVQDTHVPPAVDEVVRSTGQPLDAGTRAFMEPRFGQDFHQVRVHTDSRAEESAQALDALAYTVGRDVVFNAGQYAPGAAAGRRLIAHELAHVVQQTGRAPCIMRQCDPAWAGRPWSDRVTNAQGMGDGGAKDQCVADMIDEALYPNITVHQSSNGASSVDAAITAGLYAEMGTLSDLHVNYDRNLNNKTGKANQYGETKYRTQASTNSMQIYIILGPLALNTVGPEWTRMAFEHEQQHADDYLMESATGGGPHSATPGEELRIYQMNFEWHFLDFWQIDNTACSFSLANDFIPLFTYYATANQAARDAAFDSMRVFYEVRIQGIPCNLMKFKIWLQSNLNARPADAYVARINTLPGLGLTTGTSPSTHFTCPSPCS